MKTVSRFFLLCLVAISIASCTKTFYQVYSVKSENLSTSPVGSPVFSEDGLEFTYNFWGENGNVRFIIYNSNDYDVVVDMTKSSFIRNNLAEDYYQGKQIETRMASAVYRSSKKGCGISVDKRLAGEALINYLGKTYDVALSIGAEAEVYEEVGVATKREWQTAIVQSERELIRIPAKSAKAFCTFNVNSSVVMVDGLRAKYAYDPLEFSRVNTPMKIRNRICIYKEGEQAQFYDMDFYISEIGNVQSLSDLVNPASFYIPYSSKLQKALDQVSPYTLENKQNTSVASSAPKGAEEISNPINEEVENISSTVKVYDQLTYNGVEAIIGSITNGQAVLIATKSKVGTWDEAMEYCKSLGEGWKLPSVKEIGKISNYLDESDYWTIDSDETKAKYYKGSANWIHKADKSKEFYIQPIAVVSVEDLQ